MLEEHRVMAVLAHNFLVEVNQQTHLDATSVPKSLCMCVDTKYNNKNTNMTTFVRPQTTFFKYAIAFISVINFNSRKKSM